MRINWGILGTSPISFTMAKAIQESKTSKLIAIAGRRQLAAQHFAQEFSLLHFYADYHDLLSNPDIHAVYIGLPNHLHKEWIINCARAGKHVLCEKPLVLSASEAKEVMSTVQHYQVLCMEALMYRFHPFTKALLDLLEKKAIGEIKLFNATYVANITAVANPIAGGSIRNLGCYPISLVRLLANAEPIELRALGRLGKNNNDNQASILMKFADDAMAVVSTADDMEMQYHFDIYGTKGNLKVTTNPWMPNRENNQCLLYHYETNETTQINITAEQSLYTYQVEKLNQNILTGNFSFQNEKMLTDSLGNITVLEAWLKLIKSNIEPQRIIKNVI